nr:hypothetical protein [Tanacetum cinerariifolium]
MIECKSSDIHSYEGNIDNDFMNQGSLLFHSNDNKRFKGDHGLRFLVPLLFSTPSSRGMIHKDLSNSAKIDSSKGYSGGGVIDLIGDEDPTDGDGDTEMNDSTRV